ncbi:MAG: hypothetical protein WCS65_09465 [Verrucomicrobiae bacterium]
MSPKQTVYYFTLWNNVMVEMGWHHLPAAEKNAKRYALHKQAGCPPSSKGFSNQHFNRFKTRCEAIIAGKNDGGMDKVDADDARRRLVWRIKDDAKKAGLSPEYIKEVARDLHVLGNWEDLDLDSLKNLMLTIHNRASGKVGADTRKVPHTCPVAPAARRRRYILDMNPSPFVPSSELAHAAADNEPF